MKRLRVPPLALVGLAVVAGVTGQAGASNPANATGGPTMASYPQYGYAAYNYPAAGYGYAGYGVGGYKVKVHNRHPPRGYRAGPLAGGSCSYVYGYPTTWGHFQRYHQWRTRLLPCSAGGSGIFGPTFEDPTPAQPQTSMPLTSELAPAESLEPPAPLPLLDNEPLDNEPLNNEPPLPGDGSST